MIIYMFQCHSPKSSHPRPLPQSPKDCSIHLCLFCYLTYRVIVTIFLNSIYMCYYTVLVFFFLAHFTLYNRLQFKNTFESVLIRLMEFLNREPTEDFKFMLKLSLFLVFFFVFCFFVLFFFVLKYIDKYISSSFCSG